MKTRKQKSKRFRRGSIVGLVLIIGVCLAIIGWGMLQLGFGARVNSATSVDRLTAREAADAGLRYALKTMNEAFPSTSWPTTGSGTLPNSNAGFTYEITIVPGATPRLGYYDHYQIKSTGTSGGEQRTVYGITGVRNMLDYGLIVTDRIDLKQNTLVDGYTSFFKNPDGTYTPARYGDILPDGTLNVGKTVKVGTTSIEDDMILLHQNVTITGDVLVGIDGNIDTIIRETPEGGSNTGPWSELPEPWTFDPDKLKITVPEDVLYSADITKATFDGAGQSFILIDNRTGLNPYLRFHNISIPSSSAGTTYRLVVLGNVDIHVTNDIDIGQGSVIYVGGDPLAETPIPFTPSSLKIFLDGDIRAGNSNGINNLSEIPANFRLIGTGPGLQDWDIANGGDFYGVYYGPNADITIYAKGEVYGSVSGQSFEFKVASGSSSTSYGLHYDSSLADLVEYDTGFGIDRWWEKSGP